MAENIVKVYKNDVYFENLDVKRDFTVLDTDLLSITNKLVPDTMDVFFKGETIKFEINVTNGTGGNIPVFKIVDDFSAAITVTDVKLTADAAAGIVLTWSGKGDPNANHVEVNAASFLSAAPTNTFKLEVTGTAN